MLAFLVLGLALSSCARKKAALPDQEFSPMTPAAGAPVSRPEENQLPLTPETALIGKVAMFNKAGRFVVISFPIGHLPALEQRMSICRRGLKVGEVKITGPQQEDNVVADLTSGEAQVGDEVLEK